MFTRLTARSIILSTMALMALTACGDAGLLGQNKKTMRGNADGSRDPSGLGEEGGSLSLTMPAGHAQFAKVSTIEIRMWTERYGVDQGTTRQVICQTSNPPRCFDENRREVPPGTALPPSIEPEAPIVRRFAYKPSEKAKVSDVPTGYVSIEIDLLDASGQALFTGSGYAQVQKGQTASAVVYVSPTPGKGNLSIIIRSDDEETRTPVEPLPIVGGYKMVAKSDAGIQKAATFALTKIKPDGKFTLKAVTQAAVQLVAGVNMAFSMDIQAGLVTETYQVIVYQALDGKMTLTEATLTGSWAQDLNPNTK